MSDPHFIQFDANGEKILLNVSTIRCIICTKKERVIIIDDTGMDYRPDASFEDVVDALNKSIDITVTKL